MIDRCRKAVQAAMSQFEGNSFDSPSRSKLTGDPLALATAVGGNSDVAIYSAPVTTEGRVELLPFLREQSVSITAHRFGNPDRAMAGLTV